MQNIRQANPADETLKAKLNHLREEIEMGIDTLLPPKETRPSALHTAMRYSMEASGKRIRPVLLILASELFPSDRNPIAAAVAIECLHTYTLIHDDLPSVDNSDLRRGSLSCHKQFDEPTALLAGDALLTYAFQLISTSYRDAPELANSLIQDLSIASGSEQLIGGQMEDIANEGKLIDSGMLTYIHEKKTAALLTACLTMGLRFGAPSEDQLSLISRVGFHIGMNFQIVDDILDATSTAETMGKPVGNDASSNKLTYVALYGVNGAREKAQDHIEKALAALDRLGGENRFLSSLIEEIGNRAH